MVTIFLGRFTDFERGVGKGVVGAAQNFGLTVH